MAMGRGEDEEEEEEEEPALVAAVAALEAVANPIAIAPDGSSEAGESTKQIVRENGVQYWADPVNDQKTVSDGVVWCGVF
jgi:hypothetical protein